jgi:hypothetical protein
VVRQFAWPSSSTNDSSSVAPNGETPVMVCAVTMPVQAVLAVVPVDEGLVGDATVADAHDYGLAGGRFTCPPIEGDGNRLLHLGSRRNGLLFVGGCAGDQGCGKCRGKHSDGAV